MKVLNRIVGDGRAEKYWFPSNFEVFAKWWITLFHPSFPF